MEISINVFLFFLKASIYLNLFVLVILIWDVGQRQTGRDERNLRPYQTPDLPYLNKHTDVSAKLVAPGDDCLYFSLVPFHPPPTTLSLKIAVTLGPEDISCLVFYLK